MIPRNLGAVGSLSLAVFHDWNPDRLFVIVTVYIDESGTHGSAPLMTFSGFVGRLGQWVDFDAKWKRLLKRFDLPFFHSKDMSSWKDADRAEFLKLAAKIVGKHTQFGFSIMLRLSEFQANYVDALPPTVPRDSAYGLCFRFCLSVIPGVIEKAFGTDTQIHFVLESGHHNRGGAVAIFDEVRAEVPELGEKFKTIAFGRKKDFPGLQGADAMAHRAFGSEVNESAPHIDRDPNSTFRDDQRATDSKVPLYRMAIGRPELQEFCALQARAAADRKRAKNWRKLQKYQARHSISPEKR